MPPSPSRSPSEAATELRTLADRWRGSTLGEKQAFQLWFLDFCDALGVERPAPDGSGTYCFEQPVKVITAEGALTTNFIDCWKEGVASECSSGPETECLWDIWGYFNGWMYTPNPSAGSSAMGFRFSYFGFQP